MTESELGALCQAEIAAALEYDRSDFMEDRVRAIEYFLGEMRDLPAEEGRSSATSHDVRDIITWMLPSLMRVFFSSDQIGTYEPRLPQDEAAAKQATDYVNYVVITEGEGYQVFWDVFHDALLHANGIVKHWWDTSPRYTTHIVTGLSDDQTAMLLSDEDIEVIEHETAAGEFGPLHSLKFRRVDKSGRLVLSAVPPEEFLIDARALDLDSARFIGHRTLKTRSELIMLGFDAQLVENLPTFGSLSFDRVDMARRDHINAEIASPGIDKSTELVEVVECYIDADQDGDGVAEKLRVMVGGGGSTQVLDWETWESDLPFSDFVGERFPHRWQGRSIFDEARDVQKIKTVLLRQMLDNLYHANIPDRVVNESMVKNPDALYDRQIGNVIRVSGDPNAAVADKAVPFVAGSALDGISYMDQVVERRTGVSRTTMALDAEALQNQSATAVMAAQSASYSKIELIARNFAEMGFKRFFRRVLKLIVENQDRPRTIRLRGQWVEMDPRSWNADMDFNVNVGLGTGSRDRDTAVLMQIAGKQEQIIAQAGPMNPLADITRYANTLRKMVESTGLRNPDEYFGEVSPEVAQAFAAQGQKPDPKMAQAQAQIQIDQQKAISDAQLRQQQAAADIETQRQKNAMELDQQQQLNAMTMQQKREAAAFDLQQKREEAALNAQLRREEMMLEFELTRQSNAMKLAAGSNGGIDDNIQRQSIPE